MNIVSNIVRRFCRALADRLPVRVITTGDDYTDPYLERYYVAGAQPSGFPAFCEMCEREMQPAAAPRRCTRGYARFCTPAPFATRLEFLPTIFLHRFVRSDQDVELHNHPWDRSIAFILAGGYREERRVSVVLDGQAFDTVKQRVVRPFTFNRIAADDFHRVDLIDDDAWTIFVTGAKAGSWGFWDRISGEYIPWREHIARQQARARGAA